MQWKIEVESRDRLGESPLWHVKEQALYWIDFYAPCIHRLFPETGKHETLAIKGATQVGSLVFVADGRLLVAVDGGLKFFDPKTGTLEFFADPDGGRDGLSYNDGKVDRQGRYFIGAFDNPEASPRGVLYHVDAKGGAQVADAGFIVCNGPAFSPDGGILYFSDSMGRQILAYDLDPQTPRLTNRRVFARIADTEGLPDGLTVDREGFVWCAHYAGSCLTRYAPDGRRVAKLDLPVPHVTSMCLGGDDLMTLYVTTGWSPGVNSAAESQDGGGALFSCRVDVPGLPERSFVLV
jgi:sugar lactone lactonase YvrE